jgi:AraC family transcriptional regulator
LAKIAVELQRALQRRLVTGAPGCTIERQLSRGEGWTVEDVICTSGPQDRPFEEQHDQVRVAIVIAGSFQYGSECAREMMTPGSLLLGNQGQSFECGHEHAAGDRCISFGYTPEYFERLAADAGSHRRNFHVPRLPALRALAPLVARACAGLAGTGDGPVREMTWEEIGVELAAQAVQFADGVAPNPNGAPPSALARVTRVVRRIERDLDTEISLASLAREAGLSPYHFLRTFEQVTGVTPHQYVLRMRLREAAVRLAAEPTQVLDVALDCGFGDVSNFNRTFRAEFGVSPREYRRKFHGRGEPLHSRDLAARAGSHPAG